MDPTEAGLKVGDLVSIELLQGRWWTCAPQAEPTMLQREDRQLAQAFGPVDPGARVSMVTGTEVVRLSAPIWRTLHPDVEKSTSWTSDRNWKAAFSTI